jgi:hypothetical protein
MSTPVTEVGDYRRITTATDTVVRNSRCQLLGIIVASSTSGTVKVWDSITAANTVALNTMPVVGGTYYPIPVNCYTGLTVTTTGTIDCTVIYNSLS